MEQPQRRFVATIKIGADDADALIAQLYDVAHYIDNKINKSGNPCCEPVSGGPTSGSIVSVIENEGITHESYFKAIEKWKEARDA